MGISGLYGQWLKTKNYTGVIVRDIPKYVSSFSVDFNHIIHKAAGLTYGYNPPNPERQEYVKKISSSVVELEFFKQITSLLLEIISLIRPRDLLIIAVDGVAPQAKIQQQRQRRYKAVMSKTADILFDSNSITPGTEMMVRLDSYLTTWVKREGCEPKMPKMTIYSGHMTPGEGEHKIMNFIREGVLTGEGSHIIYGLDADLIVLSLLAPLERIYLYKEDSEEVIDIDNLREAIVHETQNNEGVKDFVFLMSLVGNDFLPAVVSLKNKKESINEIIRSYTDVGSGIVHDDQINFDVVREVFENLAFHEKDHLYTISNMKTEFPIEAFDTTKTEKGIDMVNFRKRWYDTHMEPKGNSDDIEWLQRRLKTSLVPHYDKVAKTMADKYILGMAWVFTYYTQGRVNYSYVYDYFFAPLMVDLAKFEIPSVHDYHYDPDIKMFHPFYQLISVIPPASQSVLPSDLQKLYKPTSSITDMLPIRVLIDLQGAPYDERHQKTQDWHGVVIIPPVDVARVIEAVRNLNISESKWIKYSHHDITTSIKPPDLESVEREHRLLTKSVRQERTKPRGQFEYDPNAWRAVHHLF